MCEAPLLSELTRTNLPSGENAGEFSRWLLAIQRTGSTLAPEGIGIGIRYSACTRTALTNASMFPFRADVMLLPATAKGSCLTSPPPEGARYPRMAPWRLLRPSRTNSSPSGNTSNDAIEASPSSLTGSQLHAGSAHRWSALSLELVSRVA